MSSLQQEDPFVVQLRSGIQDVKDAPPHMNLDLSPCSLVEDFCSLPGLSALEASRESILVIDLATNAVCSQIVKNGDCYDLSPDGAYLLVNHDSTVEIIDTRSGTLLHTQARLGPGSAKWVSNDMLAYWTADAVYRCEITLDASPTKVFPLYDHIRDQLTLKELSGFIPWHCYISASKDYWCLEAYGIIQVYNIPSAQSQIFQGFCPTLCEVENNSTGITHTLLIIAQPSPDEISRDFEISITDLHLGDQCILPSHIYVHTTQPQVLLDSRVRGDFGVLYTLLTYGVHMHDLASGASLYNIQFGPHVTKFTSFGSSDLVYADDEGFVSRVRVNKSALIRYVQYVLDDKPLADDIAARIHKHGGLIPHEGPYQSSSLETFQLEGFEGLLEAQQYDKAAIYAAKSINGCLRTPDILNKLRTCPRTPLALPPIELYLSNLLESQGLNEHESVEAIQLAIGYPELIEGWLRAGKLTPTESLGDLVMGDNLMISLEVYRQCGAHKRVVECYAKAGMFDEISLYAGSVGYQPDYIRLLKWVANHTPS